MPIKPLSISQVNKYIKRILQSDPILSNITVIGEISNLTYHGSGHVYFTLKDDESKLSCFFSYEYVKDLRYELSEEMEITAVGNINVYEKGGSYSLNVRQVIVTGIGDLALAFQIMKEKLEKERLFDQVYKKKIPKICKKIVVITSETGAVIRDIITTVRKKNRSLSIVLYPCLVQGEHASKEIANAINHINTLFKDADVAILARGGGSTEDLWSFNEEIVARAIFNSEIPIVSAIGHESDFTISDMVADVRAATPTAAAELVAFDETQMLKDAKYLKNELLRAVKAKYEMMLLKLVNQKNLLEILNPENVLKKGYAVVKSVEGEFIKSSKAVKLGDEIVIILKDGNVNAKVIN